MRDRDGAGVPPRSRIAPAFPDASDLERIEPWEDEAGIRKRRPSVIKRKRVLPSWTKSAGGDALWQSWVKKQVTRCCARAKMWVKKHGRNSSDLGRASQWREAIIQALHDCGGSGQYSRLPLSLAAPGKNTDWNWPSLDHVEAPNVLSVAVETRLVNDMKGIMSASEFLEMVSHIAAVNAVPPQALPDGWRCSRSFAIPEPVDEPPLSNT